jgi:hypothetical protein
MMRRKTCIRECMIFDRANVVPVHTSPRRSSANGIQDDKTLRSVLSFFAAHNDAAFFIV